MCIRDRDIAILGLMPLVYHLYDYATNVYTELLYSCLLYTSNIVGTLGVLYSGGSGTVYQALAAAFTGITGYSFLVFNLLRCV